MNEQNEILEMARHSGAASGKPTPDAPEIVFTQCLDIYHFAKLVAAKEREAIIDLIPGGFSVDPQWLCDAIRARGEKA